MIRALLFAATVLAFTSACSGNDSHGDAETKTAADTAPGAHEHNAPHGGTLIELGDEVAHLEAVLDSAEGALTLYVLDKEAEKGVRVRTPAIGVSVTSGMPPRTAVLNLSAVANSLTGDTAEEAAEFRVTSNELRGLASADCVIPSVAVYGVEFRDLTFSVKASAPPTQQ